MIKCYPSLPWWSHTFGPGIDTAMFREMSARRHTLADTMHAFGRNSEETTRREASPYRHLTRPPDDENGARSGTRVLSFKYAGPCKVRTLTVPPVHSLDASTPQRPSPAPSSTTRLPTNICLRKGQEVGGGDIQCSPKLFVEVLDTHPFASAEAGPVCVLRGRHAAGFILKNISVKLASTILLYLSEVCGGTRWDPVVATKHNLCRTSDIHIIVSSDSPHASSGSP